MHTLKNGDQLQREARFERRGCEQRENAKPSMMDATACTFVACRLHLTLCRTVTRQPIFFSLLLRHIHIRPQRALKESQPLVLLRLFASIHNGKRGFVEPLRGKDRRTNDQITTFRYNPKEHAVEDSSAHERNEGPTMGYNRAVWNVEDRTDGSLELEGGTRFHGYGKHENLPRRGDVAA